MFEIITIVAFCSIVGSIFIIRGVQIFACGFGLMKRGTFATGVLECPIGEKLRIERNYVRFTDSSGNEIRARLWHEVPDGIRNNGVIRIVYDKKKPKRVIVEGYNRFRFMSNAFFLMGIGIMVSNIAVYMLLIVFT